VGRAGAVPAEEAAMNPPPWNEAGLSEDPAVASLQRLGYLYVRPQQLEGERESLRDVVLRARLAASLMNLNPWLSRDNVQKAIRTIATMPATSLLEANEKVWTALTYGIAVEQDLGGGKRGHQVRFIDFDHPEKNELVVTRQFRVLGVKKHVIPDVVLFVNGLPVVVVECKSPTLADKWLHDAVDQVHRYQETTSAFRDLGAPQLFHTVQLIVATCGQAAAYGTVGTPQRFFHEWKVPHPLSVDALGKELGRPATPQDILFHGMLAPERLLDIIRGLVVFERDPSSSRTIRKMCRYQQYAAVGKAVERIGRAKKPADRGGVVWHTQGSGKSLTMLWLALKLRRDPMHENPTLVIVTDRRDLDEQITRTFHNCGFPNPDRAESVRDLKGLLSGPGGRTIMTTVQKFQEIAGSDRRGKLSRAITEPFTTASNVFVLTDEAHRTQYGTLAANLRQALPNAAFFAFTGTPIDKKDRSTLQTFGSYIDTYTIEQAVADHATVPIFYESRLPDLRIVGNTLDQVFDRVFADRSPEERAAIKKKYANEQTIACAPKRIEAICLDLIDHFTKFIQPNGFKAQVVAVSREAAVLYKETLDRLNAPQSAIVMSGSNDDEAYLVRHHTSVEDRKAIVARYLDRDDPLSLLVVCDMLLTGFDAPVEQVMYLDSPLKEHTLLQAIARVNRTADKKDYGLVVDYWGVSDALQESLAIFAPSDIKGALEPKEDELPRLQARHSAAMRFFVRVKDRKDLDACLRVLEAEDVRAEFDAAFRRYSESLDMLLPDPRALPYVEDMGWLGKIRQAARARFRDATLDISDCGAKVRRLIEEAIIADGVRVLVKEVNLFSPEFDDKMDALKGPDAKASEMEHAIRHEIHVRLEEDPAFFQSLRERLEEIIEQRKAQRIDAAKQLELLDGLRREAQGRQDTAAALGLSETALAIYGLLVGGTPTKMDEARKALAEDIEESVEPQTRIVDWTKKDDVQREIRRLIKRKLKAAQMPADQVEELAAGLLELLKARRGL